MTPLVLSDLTSGLNIAENVSLEESLNALCGFTEKEVGGLLADVAAERGGASVGSGDAHGGALSVRDRGRTRAPLGGVRRPSLPINVGYQPSVYSSIDGS